MKIKSGSASESVKSAQQTLEQMMRKSKEVVEGASNNWTDTLKNDFFKKYIREFIDVQESTQSDLKSILLSVVSIENMLSRNIN
jgi:hypothetical protein